MNNSTLSRLAELNAERAILQKTYDDAVDAYGEAELAVDDNDDAAVEIVDQLREKQLDALMYLTEWDIAYQEELRVCASVPTLEQTIARMQSEILADVQYGKVNAAVSSFSQLHDYVDANEYGGFWDDALLDALIQHFGGRDYNGSMPDGLMDFINAAQAAIDAWLRAGGIQQAIKE